MRVGVEVGGTFTLFGGYITGRHLEMLPNERLVQAWRAGSWNPGAYSIAAFHLTAEGGKTKVALEHRGFPNGQGISLALLGAARKIFGAKLRRTLLECEYKLLLRSGPRPRPE